MLTQVELTVHPAYPITVDTPPVRVDVPDWLPGVPDEVDIPSRRYRVSYLGHAGILFFSSQGESKYYEYGRYDRAAIGLVRRQEVPNLRITANGKPTLTSLNLVLNRISITAGHRGHIVGSYIELAHGAFNRMLAYATRRMSDNINPNRIPYDLTSNSCIHFMTTVAKIGGARMPHIIDPRPAGYIDRVRYDHPDLDFNLGSNVAIEGIHLR